MCWHELRTEDGIPNPKDRFSPNPPRLPVAQVTGFRMNDKIRHRPVPAPKGHLPNWALVLCIAGAIVLVSVARSIV